MFLKYKMDTTLNIGTIIMWYKYTHNSKKKINNNISKNNNWCSIINNKFV